MAIHPRGERQSPFQRTARLTTDLTAKTPAIVRQSTDRIGFTKEEIVILAVLRLGEQAYGATIRKLIEESTERTTSIGAIYATLDSPHLR
ncbi:MAG TPA: hypothetical protein VK582_04610 [Pyrinomonadaceae bacterium]|nr:hypothetical protein [Pyrinomonadaceae bacterium]